MAATIERAGPAVAGRGLVLVHGRGGTAADILGLGQALGIADLALAAPQHPGRSWWPTSFLAPQDEMDPHVAAGMAAVEAAIAALVDDGVPRERIALGGFSQGACLALEHAARAGGVMAVFGLSGGLVGTGDAEGLADAALYGFGPKRFDYDTDLAGIPVVIEVHASDPHIPLARAEESVAVFERLGARVELSVIPGAGHGVGPRGPAAMREILGA